MGIPRHRSTSRHNNNDDGSNCQEPAQAVETQARAVDHRRDDDNDDHDESSQDDYVNTDVNNARRWIQYVDGNYLYNHDRGSWMHWIGSHWEIDKRTLAQYDYIRLVRKLYDDLQDESSLSLRRKGRTLAKSLESVTTINRALQAASWDPSLSTLADDYNSDPYILNVLNVS